MKITKRQLRRIIKEEKQKLIHETPVQSPTVAPAVLGLAVDALSDAFAAQQQMFFVTDPGAFEGRSTKEEWAWQVDAATAMLEEELAFALEKVESMLHDGQFHTG
tara:strand:- start:88 stop:402 length:315 start_codon:yes stop_codon:yes gene_type:complete